ncbi:hypothetical protein D3C71_1286950 [compost metagenome]
MSAGVPSNCMMGRVNSPPNTATTAPKIRPTSKVVPAMVRTLSNWRAPQACPISTEAPAPRPMTKAMNTNITGKKAATAASALNPIIWPRNMLLSVPDRDCRMLDRIMGPRKTMNTFHRGRCGAFPEGCVSDAGGGEPEGCVACAALGTGEAEACICCCDCC